MASNVLENLRAEHQRGYTVVDGFKQMTVEAAAAMSLSPMATSHRMSGCLGTWPEGSPGWNQEKIDWETIQLIIFSIDFHGQ